MFHASCLVHFMFVVSDYTRNPRGRGQTLVCESVCQCTLSVHTVTQSSERRCLSEHVPIIKKLVTNFLDLLKPSLTLCMGFLLVTSRPFCFILRQDQSLLYQDMLATSPKSDGLFSARRGREPCAGHHLHRVCVLLPRLPSDQSTSRE